MGVAARLAGRAVLAGPAPASDRAWRKRRVGWPRTGPPQVDPGSEAHDLVMSLYGGMSKGERTRKEIIDKAFLLAGNIGLEAVSLGVLALGGVGLVGASLDGTMYTSILGISVMRSR